MCVKLQTTPVCHTRRGNATWLRFAKQHQHISVYSQSAGTSDLCDWRMLQQLHACHRGVWLASRPGRLLHPAALQPIISHLTAHQRAGHIALGHPNISSLPNHSSLSCMHSVRLSAVFTGVSHNSSAAPEARKSASVDSQHVLHTHLCPICLLRA